MPFLLVLPGPCTEVSKGAAQVALPTACVWSPNNLVHHSWEEEAPLFKSCGPSDVWNMHTRPAIARPGFH